LFVAVHVDELVVDALLPEELLRALAVGAPQGAVHRDLGVGHREPRGWDCYTVRRWVVSLQGLNRQGCQEHQEGERWLRFAVFGGPWRSWRFKRPQHTSRVASARVPALEQ